ncbi:50S ribosomal protein L21e [Aeropyrum pernix]|uniref:50S ribosomal protein L21e n=1 Tax=Aeropyrum pernix TaxID=56636 RepID=UPI001037C46F|nr:50S ribosomal protein L21e [Aeropyrum pernix]
MVKAPRGYRNRTRRLLRKPVREKGSIPRLSTYLREYRVGDKVAIIINPSFPDWGMPHRRFHGLTGTVVGRRGEAYEVEVYLGRKRKTLFVPPVHLKPLSTAAERRGS